MPENSPDIIQSADGLVADVRSMIEQTREGVARAVNSGMTLLYWRIGKRIQAEVLHNQRAEYGQEILATLSQELTALYGRGFDYSSLTRMLKFAEIFPEGPIVATLSRQLGWSHFKELIPLKEPLQREFYAEMCRVERWSVRTLRQKPKTRTRPIRHPCRRIPDRPPVPRSSPAKTPRRHRALPRPL